MEQVPIIAAPGNAGVVPGIPKAGAFGGSQTLLDCFDYRHGSAGKEGRPR